MPIRIGRFLNIRIANAEDVGGAGGVSGAGNGNDAESLVQYAQELLGAEALPNHSIERSQWPNTIGRFLNCLMSLPGRLVKRVLALLCQLSARDQSLVNNDRSMRVVPDVQLTGIFADDVLRAVPYPHAEGHGSSSPDETTTENTNATPRSRQSVHLIQCLRAILDLFKRILRHLCLPALVLSHDLQSGHAAAVAWLLHLARSIRRLARACRQTMWKIAPGSSNTLSASIVTARSVEMVNLLRDESFWMIAGDIASRRDQAHLVSASLNHVDLQMEPLELADGSMLVECTLLDDGETANARTSDSEDDDSE